MNILNYIKNFLIRLGDFMGTIMTAVILTILYCVVVGAVKFVSMIFRKKFVDTRFGIDSESYFDDFEKDFNNPSLDKMKLPF